MEGRGAIRVFCRRILGQDVFLQRGLIYATIRVRQRHGLVDRIVKEDIVGIEPGVEAGLAPAIRGPLSLASVLASQVEA